MGWRVFMPTNLEQILNGDKFAATVLEKLILRARNEDGTFYHLGEPVFLKRGQCLCGREELAENFGMKRNEALRMQRILEKLEKVHKQINKQKGRNCSIITIINYDVFTSTEQSNELSMNNQRTINEQSMNTNQNDKNDKNEKNEKNDPGLPVSKNGYFPKFLESFNQITKSKFRKSDKLEKQFYARLKDGFTPEEMIKATLAASKNQFLMGVNDGKVKYLTPEYILRADKLNQWVNQTQAQATETQEVHETDISKFM